MKWDEHQREIAKKIDRWERNAIFKGGFELGEQKAERRFQKKFILRLDGMGYEPAEIVKLSGVSLEDVQKILNGEDLNSDQ